MKLIELWNVSDGEALFLLADGTFVPVLDGPGFPVVNGKDVSDVVVRRIRPTTYPLFGNVLEITPC